MSIEFIVINKYKNDDISEKVEAVTKIVEKLINNKFEKETNVK